MNCSGMRNSFFGNQKTTCFLGRPGIPALLYRLFSAIPVKMKNIPFFRPLVSFFVFFLLAVHVFADNSRARSQPPALLSETEWIHSVAAQALINSDPRNPEGYRLLAASQASHAQWVDLLKTVEMAERNGILDPFLFRQKASAFLSLGDFQKAFNALRQTEILARNNVK